MASLGARYLRREHRAHTMSARKNAAFAAARGASTSAAATGAAAQFGAGSTLVLQVVLACADGDRTHAQIAADLQCKPVTVSNGGTGSPPTASTVRSTPAARGPANDR